MHQMLSRQRRSSTGESGANVKLGGMLRYVLAVAILAGCSAPPPASTPTPAATTPVAVVTPEATPTPAPTPAAEDVERVLTARYEELAYVYTTRDIDKLMDFSSGDSVENGKPLSKAMIRKSYEEEFADQAVLEQEAGESLRFSLVNKILKVTSKGPGKASARVRTNTRMNTRDGFYVIEEVMEDTDHWVKEKDGVWRIRETTDEKPISLKKIIDGKPTPLPLE